MADDELIVNIEKALWPKGVVRGLAPVLRTLGDKHGGIVIAAQPLKGHIMMKGAADKIEEAKPGLRAIIEEYFPDADTPEELLDGSEKAAAAPPEEPAPAAPAAPAAPSAPRRNAQSAAMPLDEPVVVEGPPAHPRKRSSSCLAAGPDILWQCMRKNSAFLRVGAHGKRRFSAEPGNLMGLHTFQFSGLANAEALDIRPVVKGDKESIELVQSHAKASRKRRPRALLVSTGIQKTKKKGMKKLGRELVAKYYRPGLHNLAKLKLLKIQQSFKKKRSKVKSRRAKE
eukprot:TRINITY_DN14753_c0_g1_i2.p1 TRINITY_DN14753_c0_g1~~TRINITY_DN14753_c0_g1_i2.p1  ORF type:complete len:285 (-),score=79.95 TRINITY_DN14753_c0_g1_i2:150-1004(-)